MLPTNSPDCRGWKRWGLHRCIPAVTCAVGCSSRQSQLLQLEHALQYCLSIQKEPTPALLPSRLLFAFQYFVFDFHVPPDVMFDKIIKLSVSEHGCVVLFVGLWKKPAYFVYALGIDLRPLMQDPTHTQELRCLVLQASPLLQTPGPPICC